MTSAKAHEGAESEPSGRLSAPARDLLAEVLVDREALVDAATDRVYRGSPDLTGKRSRVVTRVLVARVFACSEAALLRGDESELDVFIDHVTGIRAERDYHVSTLLMGFRSFRGAIEEPVRRLAPDGWTAWELITAVDDIYSQSSQRAADMLVERQYAAMAARQAQVERSSFEVAEELRHHREIAAALRSELDGVTLALLRLEQELRDRTAVIRLLTAGDPEARKIVERLPPGPEQLDALRELRREITDGARGDD